MIEGILYGYNFVSPGSSILADNPENNSEKILKFKDNPITKSLSRFGYVFYKYY